MSHSHKNNPPGSSPDRGSNPSPAAQPNQGQQPSRQAGQQNPPGRTNDPQRRDQAGQQQQYQARAGQSAAAPGASLDQGGGLADAARRQGVEDERNLKSPNTPNSDRSPKDDEGAPAANRNQTDKDRQAMKNR